MCWETSARWPGSGGVSSSTLCPRRRRVRPWPSRTTTTWRSSSSRRSWDSVRSRPAAIFCATASVGLVSPRSTCDSIGALTPLRSARSRSERSIASRRLLTRAPTAPSGVTTVPLAVSSRGARHLGLYVITYVCMRGPCDGPAAPVHPGLRWLPRTRSWSGRAPTAMVSSTSSSPVCGRARSGRADCCRVARRFRVEARRRLGAGACGLAPGPSVRPLPKLRPPQLRYYRLRLRLGGSGLDPSHPVGLPGTWRLVFDDEFNGQQLDLSRWNPNWFGGPTM